jgi:hypothetical protein
MLALLGLLSSLQAADYDPDLTWRTITTEHFDIHFHQSEEQLADEFSVLVEEVYARMTEEMAWEPRRRTQLVLVDRTDQANGYAMTVPWNTIVIYVTAPQEDSTLGLYEDWSETILTHELTHVLHLDTNHGLVRLARQVVGRVASTNQLSPWWIVEGLATFEETRYTTGGRGRTPLVDMYKRTAVLEDAFPPLGNLDGLQAAPPAGNLRYLFGQDFIQFIADTRGRDVWTKWTHTYGSGLPWLLPGKRVFGEGLQALYGEWKEALELRYATEKAEIESEGLREGRLVSIGDASCTAPSFSPDGDKLVWSCNDLAEGSAIWMSDGDGYAPEKLLQDYGAKNFTWRRDSKAFVYASTHVVNRFNTWSDIYLHELGNEGVSSLTNGKRARDPDFSPDGEKLLVVTNKAQDNQLQVMRVDRTLEALTEHDDHTQMSTPRWAPDGRSIAVSVWTDGRRDLWLYSPEGEPLRRLTIDAFVDRDPEWSADGRWLYFSSDRTGVPNVYAIEIATERLYQVTNVLTGAVNPSVSPNARWLAYQQYSSDGWDVRILDLREVEKIDRGLLPRPVDSDVPLSAYVSPVDQPIEPAQSASLWSGDPLGNREAPAALNLPAQAPGESVDTFEQAEVEDVFGEEQDYPFRIEPHRYRPLETLRPSFWLPLVQLSPYDARRFEGLRVGIGDQQRDQAFVGSVFTGGVDTLHHGQFSADLNYRSDADLVGGGVNVVYNRWLPVYSIGVRRTAVPFPAPYALDDTAFVQGSDRYWEDRMQAAISVSYPYTFRTSVFGRYAITRRRALDALPEGIDLQGIPTRGYIGAIQGGWRYSWSQPTALSVSPEDARIFSVVGGILHPWLGTWLEDEDGFRPFSQVQLTSELREYVVNPWIPNHVLAMRIAGGATLGPTDFFGTYQLGGNIGDAAFYATPDEFRMVRGHPLGADVGDMYWLGGLEYRAPIWRIDRGWGPFPLFLRYLAGAAFVDAGNAFVGVPKSWDQAFDDSLVGVGAELRLSAVAGWSTGFTARLGYATALDSAGYQPGDIETFYLLGGSSF